MKIFLVYILYITIHINVDLKEARLNVKIEYDIIYNIL